MTVGKPQREVIDRAEEIGKLVGSLSDPSKHVNYALIGPRRIGKTTILLEVKRQLERDQIITAYVDLSVYKFSPYDFAQNIMSQITRAYAKEFGRIEKASVILDNLLKTLTKLKKLRLTLEPSIDPKGQFSIQIKPEIEETQDYRDVFLLPFEYANEISRKSGRRVVVMIDEFPSLIEFRRCPKLGAIVEIFRGVLEGRENVEYVVSGSKVHYMRDILGNGENPLFGHFVMMEIGPLPKEYAIQLYSESAKSDRKEAEDACGIVGGHPYFLIMLGENRRADESVEETYKRILTSSSGALYLYVNYILKEDLGSSTKEVRLMRILHAIARGKVTPSEIARQIRLKLSSLPFYLQELEKYDLIEKREGKYLLKDKVINDYLAMLEA